MRRDKRQALALLDVFKNHKIDVDLEGKVIDKLMNYDKLIDDKLIEL